MLKKLMLFQTLFFCFFKLNAQEWNTMKLGVEIGFPIGTASENLSLLFNLEPKLKVSKTISMGIRLAIAVNSQTFKNHDSNKFIIDDGFDHGFLSVVPTFDYHWQKENFSPYVGLGIGPYSLANKLDINSIGTTNPNEDVFEVKVGYQIGLLIRGGFEMRKLRFGIEYNFVPKTTIESPNGQKIGTVNSSYLGMSLGMVIGAGKK
jgi:hypothetical protein